MDYFSVIVLLIVTFVFVTDRKPKSIENIFQNNKFINNDITLVKNSIQIIKKDFSKMSFKTITQDVFSTDKKYILIQNDKTNMKEEEIQVVIANFINSGYNICAFNLKYVCDQKQSVMKKLYINILNYINIFNKKDFSTYGLIILSKEKIENEFKTKDIISYISNDVIKITVDYTNKELDEIKQIQINELKKGKIEIILKLLTLILTGIYITTNLIKAIIVFKDITNLLTMLIIYICYLYIVKYIYEPIGRQRIIAKYMFPIYFIVYIWVLIYNKVKGFIKSVHAS